MERIGRRCGLLLVCRFMDTNIFDRYTDVVCWDDAAREATADIFDHVKQFKRSTTVIADLRTFLDVSIELNFDAGNRPFDARYGSWREVGGVAVLLAKNIGVELSPDLIVSTLVRKQRDYGHENIRRFGSQGLYVRLHDKVARLENLLSTGATPENESLQDNVMDVVGYCAIGCMWEAQKFLLPLKDVA